MPRSHQSSYFVMALALATHFLQSESLKSSMASDEPLAKGCSLVYLDIGSNVGVQVRKLFEPHKYPGARFLPYFDQYFGNEDFRKQPSEITGLCAFGFEANPHFLERLRTVQGAYKAQGWRAEFVAPRIVSDVEDRNITFYVDHAEGVNEWGSSITPWQGTGNMAEVTVKTLDFASWFEKEILPASPKVVLAKMDIEGSEYLVLPRLAKKNLLCESVWDAANIEWHPNMNPTSTDYAGFASDMNAQTCAVKTKFKDIDDETYLHDGQPLPGDFEDESNMTPESFDKGMRWSKALYMASHIDYFKRSGISAETQRNKFLTEINVLLGGSAMKLSQ